MFSEIRSEMKNYWKISIKISLLSIFFPHVQKTETSTSYNSVFPIHYASGRNVTL
jgi:hypothetical protein